MDTLTASTKALGSGTAADDSTYASIENQIESLTSSRNTLAGQIKAALDAAAFDGQAVSEQTAKGWIDQANDLLAQAHDLASS